MRFPLLIAAACLLAAPALSQTATDCDRLAGYPHTPRLPGLAPGEIGPREIRDPAAAVAACEAARAAEDDPFLAFLLARAREALDPQDPTLPALIEEGRQASAPFADSRLGLLYESGHGGVVPDEGLSRQLAEQSCAAMPDPRAWAGCNNVGAWRTREGDLDGAQAMFRQICEAGLGISCLNLAELLESDRGIDPGELPARLFDLYARACDLGDSFGCTQAGYAHETGAGTPADGAAAERRYARACTAGEAYACWALGEMLDAGTALPRDWPRAQELLGRACALGTQAACVSVAMGLIYGPDGNGPAPVADSIAEGIARLEALCEAGQARACAELGYAFAHWQPVTSVDGSPVRHRSDPLRGSAYSARACAMGEGLGCQDLALQFEQGLGVEASPQRAAQYYERGCALGVGEACAGLAGMLASGAHVPADAAAAESYFVKACDLGVVEACRRLQQ